MLAFTYVAAALLELAGITITVRDVLAGARRVKTLSEQLSLRTRVSRHTPADRAAGIASRAAARADQQLADAIADLLGGKLRRRLLGPALLALGVIVGAAANIAALCS